MSSNGFLDNFTLGVAGATDLITRADDALGFSFIPNTNNATKLYAAQVRDGGKSYSSFIDTARSSGANPKEVAKLAAGAADNAVTAGALSKAATNTADKIADKAVGAAEWGVAAVKRAEKYLPFIVGGVAITAVALVVVVYLPKP